MASKKVLKQSINGIAGELFAECLFCRLYVPGVDSEKTDRILAEILDMQVDFLAKSNHSDAKSNRKLVKAYYHKLKEDLTIKVNEIGDEIGSLNEKKEA